MVHLDFLPTHSFNFFTTSVKARLHHRQHDTTTIPPRFPAPDTALPQPPNTSTIRNPTHSTTNVRIPHQPLQPPPPQVPTQIYLCPRHCTSLPHNILSHPARTHCHHPSAWSRSHIPLYALAALVVRRRRMGTRRRGAFRQVL